LPMSRSDRPIRTRADAEAWLEGLIDVERRRDLPPRRLGTGPVRALLARVGDPHAGLRVLHVAGSKGKGSTALLAEAVLRARGERVATYTSPHLERWTERFRVGGAPVADARLAAAVETLRPHVEAMKAGSPGDAPSWFDVTTAAAFLLFRDAGVDRAVIEVGLGGRLDSTNVVDPQVTCVTSIEREHVRFLGDTLGAIAVEKAGILKPGRPAVAGALVPEAAAVVEARAKALGAPLARLGQEIRADVRDCDASGLTVRVRDGGLDLEVRLPLLGPHHAANAALAVACVARLPGVDAASLPDAVQAGLAGARLPGRTEWISREPPVIVDAAHTPASAAALARALALVPHRRTRLVLSVSADKDVPAILAPLLADACEVTVTRAEPVRSLEPRAVADAVRALAPDVALHAIPNPHLALRAARARMAPGDLLCAAGSVYLAGIARRVLA